MENRIAILQKAASWFYKNNELFIHNIEKKEFGYGVESKIDARHLSFNFIDAEPMSISGIAEPCIRLTMPLPRRNGPSLRFDKGLSQPNAFAPSSRQSSRPQELMVWGTPALPSPRASNIGDVSPTWI